MGARPSKRMQVELSSLSELPLVLLLLLLLLLVSSSSSASSSSPSASFLPPKEGNQACLGGHAQITSHMIVCPYPRRPPQMSMNTCTLLLSVPPVFH